MCRTEQKTPAKAGVFTSFGASDLGATSPSRQVSAHSYFLPAVATEGLGVVAAPVAP